MESTTSFFILVLLLLLFPENVISICLLPNQWSGLWYQSSGIGLLEINKTNFMNRGICIEHRQDKFLFYEKEECYRCIFIMQKHLNVLQYRTSFCTDQNDFELNCQNLSPESELFTIYRDSSLSEKCPLNGIYAIQSSTFEDNQYQSFPKKCQDKNSAILECSDQSMLKLHFGKCANMPNYVFNCIAHWTEGSTNYLIGRVEKNNQKSIYKCLAYIKMRESTSQGRKLRDENFINLNFNNLKSESSETLQIMISQDEFCRNIDNIIDDQFSFIFNKVNDSPHLIYSQKLIRKNSNITKELAYRAHVKCKFPRWFNKKWHDLKKTKSYTLNYRLDSLLINDEKNSLVINKYTCWNISSRKTNQFQAVVKSLNGCMSGYQCIRISRKSDYVYEIKFGEISYNNHILDCANQAYTIQNFVYTDTNYGVECPMKSGIYKRINHKEINLKSPKSIKEELSIKRQIFCKFLTQTQTLQVGCQSPENYSLRTKLCYPNDEVNKLQDKSYSEENFASYTQLESEINLACLAHWKEDGNNVVISKTMSNEILCSIWSFSEDQKILKLLEIDSTCNYRKESISRVNYEFFFVDTCQIELSQFKSFIKSDFRNSTSSKNKTIYIYVLSIMFFYKNIL